MVTKKSVQSGLLLGLFLTTIGINVSRSDGLPNQVEVDAKFATVPTPSVFENEDGGNSMILGGNVTQVVFSVDLNDFLDLGKASSHTFISPALNGCILADYSFEFIGAANEILQFGATDAVGVNNCLNFMNGIKSNGLQMQFTEVPLLNGDGSAINTVVVKISLS
jgi:hypothetical protein